jgi:hypothetical protein
MTDKYRVITKTWLYNRNSTTLQRDLSIRTNTGRYKTFYLYGNNPFVKDPLPDNFDVIVIRRQGVEYYGYLNAYRIFKGN